MFKWHDLYIQIYLTILPIVAEGIRMVLSTRILLRLTICVMYTHKMKAFWQGPPVEKL